MKNHIKIVISLTAICGIVALLLALTNSLTAPLIEKQEQQAVNRTLTEVLPEGEDFTEIKGDLLALLPKTVTACYEEKGGGYVFKLTTAGYSSGLVLMCGVNAQGKVSGTACIASGETLGYEKTYGDRLDDMAADEAQNVDTVAGATKTTGAYKQAVLDALKSAEILNGQKNGSDAQ